MNQVFVVQNREGLFLSRQGEWLDGSQASALYRTPHRDLAVNELFELTSKFSKLRAKVVEVQTSERGLPLVGALAPPDFPEVKLPPELASGEPL